MKQSFSVENFKKIYFYENRKGNSLDKLISSDLVDISNRIIEINNNIKVAKKNKNFLILKTLYDYKKIILNSKDLVLETELERVYKNIRNNIFSINFNHFSLSNNKIYYLTPSSETSFIMKKLEFNFMHSFDINQSSRYQVTSQTKTFLNNNFPKVVIRTDLKSFFESIPHKELYYKINNNKILSSYSKRLTFKILNEYKKYSKLDIGVPRGLGISSYLSELYMKDIDNEIKQLKNLTYYARYVDDIIVIFTPDSMSDNFDYFNLVKTIIERYKLKLNLLKTKVFDLTKTAKNKSDSSKLVSKQFDFLGYKFFFNNIKKDFQNRVVIAMSDNKKRKYLLKIRLTFIDYMDKSRINEKKARKLLVKRLRYLTENTRLVNAKSDILVGINFSNPLFNYTPDLKELDFYLKNQIENMSPYYKLLTSYSGHICIKSLRNRLYKYSFYDGWKNKKFCKLNRNELTEVTKLWDKL